MGPKGRRVHTTFFQFDLYTFVSGFAIIIMAVAVWRVLELRSSAASLGAGRNWAMLFASVMVLFLGYLALPFFIFLPDEWKDHVLALVFFLFAVVLFALLTLLFRINTPGKKP